MTARVLLFGAYGNGNMGDTYQALSVARHLRAVRPDIQIRATSATARPYPLDGHEILPETKTIRQHDVVNQADALVIGGGGLLASLHRPLGHDSWVDGIERPIILLGVGANEEVSARCERLLRKAAVVSVRDAFSLRCVQRYRPDAMLLNDPILADPTIEPVRDGTVRVAETMAVVPRKMTPKNEGVYSYFPTIMASDDRVVTMFPTTDRASGALGAFEAGGRVVEEPTTRRGFCDALADADFVVSERYHGCIFGMKLGVPTIGMVSTANDKSSKIASLYEHFQLDQMCVSLRDRKFARSELSNLCRDVFDWSAVRVQLEETSRRFRSDLDGILSSVSI